MIYLPRRRGAFKGPTAVGEFFQGGYYFGTINVGGTDYYLICADKASGENSSIQWKTSQTTTTGTTSLVDGSANTAAMIAAGAAAHPAGNFCNNLTIGGYSDWYLPAKDELALLYDNHAALETAGSGSFADNYYWSSTESTITDAWDQYFPTGSVGDVIKDGNRYVRAIRRVAV